MGLALAWARYNWRIIVWFGAILTVFGFGYYKGYSHEHAKFTAHLNADATAVAVAKAENQRRVAEAEYITQNVIKDHTDEVAKIHDYYKSHPRIVRMCNDRNTNTVSSASKDSKGFTTTTDGASETATPAIEIDLLLAGEEVMQCQALIELETALDRIQ